MHIKVNSDLETLTMKSIISSKWRRDRPLWCIRKPNHRTLILAILWAWWYNILLVTVYMHFIWSNHVFSIPRFTQQALLSTVMSTGLFFWLETSMLWQKHIGNVVQIPRWPTFFTEFYMYDTFIFTVELDLNNTIYLITYDTCSFCIINTQTVHCKGCWQS